MSLILITFIAAVIGQLIGWVWHGPLFGKQYGHAMGMPVDSDKKVGFRDMAWQLGLNFVAMIAYAFVLFNLLGAFGAFTVGAVLRTGGIVFVGFILPLVTTNVLWNGRPVKSQWMLFGISFGYQAVVLIAWAILFALIA